MNIFEKVKVLQRNTNNIYSLFTIHYSLKTPKEF